MKPLPWSFTALNNFKTCPRQYHALRVVKTVKDVMGEAAIWGNTVHKAFETRLVRGNPLPENLKQHDAYLWKLAKLPGEKFVEHRMALDRNLQACEFFGKGVWSRGVIDFMALEDDFADVWDHKTGKVKPGSTQLALFAIYVFHTFPEVQKCQTHYYWTQTETDTGDTFTRDQLPELWAKFVPDLKQYKEAFEFDVWQPRPSGLCKKHCPVTDCEFNGLGG